MTGRRRKRELASFSDVQLRARAMRLRRWANEARAVDNDRLASLHEDLAWYYQAELAVREAETG